MSILIKGIEMPVACFDCPCMQDLSNIDEEYYICAAIEHAPEITDKNNGRLPKCPIVEIPTPHGRLIDVDKDANSILMMSSHPCGCSIENVKDVVEWLRFVNGDGNNFAFPTTIEAEVGEG